MCNVQLFVVFCVFVTLHVHDVPQAISHTSIPTDIGMKFVYNFVFLKFILKYIPVCQR